MPPVDSGLWWLIILRAHVQATRDLALAERDDVQVAIRMLLDLCLNARFDIFPTVLVRTPYRCPINPTPRYEVGVIG